MGKPVIATGWSGNREYMTQENAFLVPYELKPSAVRHGVYPAGTIWADIDIDACAEAMQSVYHDHASAREKGKRAAADIEKFLSPSQIARTIKDNW